MKYTLRAFTLFAFIVFFDVVAAQVTDWCRSDYRLKQLITNNTQAEQNWQDFTSARLLNSGVASSRAANETVYIPVVFHIVHDGDAVGTGENITDAQALSQIDALNSHFNFEDPGIINIPSVFSNLVANCNIRFCIAKFDPYGDPTTGVIRHAYPGVVSWDNESDIDNTLKPATQWDRTRYLNIWSVRMGGGTVPGTLQGDGILAYASFPPPFLSTPTDDGIVARFGNIGTTSNVQLSFRKGKTVTHEVGHWLGLLHVWGDAGCGGVGDFIADTPDQDDMNFGCPGFPHISCNNGPNGDMFMNYMDYTSENCSIGISMFTIGQANAMRNTLNNSRASIKNSAAGCYFELDAAVVKVVLPADTVCSLDFKPVVTIKNEGTATITSGKIYFQIDGGNTQIINWSGSISTQQELTLTLPLQTVAGGTHTFDITFGNVNGQLSDAFSGNDYKSISFFAYDGGSSASSLLAEDFETAYPPSNWIIYNPNNDITWVQNPNYGGYGLSNTCVSINNLSIIQNPPNKKDAFITESYDVTTITYPEMKFDLAYARNSATRSDSLNVYYSLDCGSNWIKIWNETGRTLASIDSDRTTLFLPEPSQWKTVSVPLTSIGAQSKVSFKFENVADWGNALYVDNINIQNNPALTIQEIPKQDIKVFPNPAGNLVAVRLPANHSFQQIQVINSIGEVVLQTEISNNDMVFSAADFASGLYLIHLKGNTQSQTEKLLINK